MKILVVGAGALGGYYGGRLLSAGRDVTFLVRPRRAEALRRDGLMIKSPLGDLHLAAPPLVQKEQIDSRFDLVLLSCKSYDLDDAMDSFAAAVGERTLILPMLNGMKHLDRLSERFGSDRILGGLCAIGATLDGSGQILHLNKLHTLVFGARTPAQQPRREALTAALTDAGFEGRASDRIEAEMWEKWVMLSPLAAGTTLMRSSVSDINTNEGGEALLLGLLEECRSIADANGFAPRAQFMETIHAMLTSRTSIQTASMYRDIVNNSPIEADHVIGDLIARAGSMEVPLLRMAYLHLKAYETQRARLQR